MNNRILAAGSRNAHIVVQMEEQEFNIFITEHCDDGDFAWLEDIEYTISELKDFIKKEYAELENGLQSLNVYIEPKDNTTVATEYNFIQTEGVCAPTYHDPGCGGGVWYVSIDDEDELFDVDQWKTFLSTFEYADLKVDTYTIKEWKQKELYEEYRNLEYDLKDKEYELERYMDAKSELSEAEINSAPETWGMQVYTKYEHQIEEIKEKMKVVNDKINSIKASEETDNKYERNVVIKPYLKELIENYIKVPGWYIDYNRSDAEGIILRNYNPSAELRCDIRILYKSKIDYEENGNYIIVGVKYRWAGYDDVIKNRYDYKLTLTPEIDAQEIAEMVTQTTNEFKEKYNIKASRKSFNDIGKW